MRLLFLTGLVFLASCTVMERLPLEINAQHYRVYRGDGSSSTFQDLLNEAGSMDVVFLGESHDDPVAHYLEALIFENLADPELALSLEMFETDVQYVVDEYLQGQITEDHLISSGRAWQNYEKDYKPLIEFARENNLPVIAANPPRRYVNLVGREGRQALLELSPQARQTLPPLPYAGASAAYRNKFMALMQESMSSQTGQAGKAGEVQNNSHTDAVEHEADQEAAQEQHAAIERTLEAQSLWNAGMAWSIGTYLSEHPGSRVVHVNGIFHSAERLGILDHLREYRPQTSMLVVSIIPADNFPEFGEAAMLNQGDFVIVTDASLPRSY